MTLSELINHLQTLEASGHGALQVYHCDGDDASGVLLDPDFQVTVEQYQGPWDGHVLGDNPMTKGAEYIRID